MPWPYTSEQIISILAAVGVLVGVMVKGIMVILSRIDDMQADSRKRTVEVKAQVEEKASTIEEKVDVVKIQSDGRLTSIEAELRASRQEAMGMARELSMIGELRRQEEITRRTLAEEVARAAQVAHALLAHETAQVMDLAHRQMEQQHATAVESTTTETVESVTVQNPVIEERRIIVP